jgi:hypothetical protein
MVVYPASHDKTDATRTAKGSKMVQILEQPSDALGMDTIPIWIVCAI